MKQNRKKLQSENNIVVSLPSEVVLKEVKPYVVKSQTISIESITDYPSIKKVVVKTSELGNVTLWENESYDIIGQWTDIDVQTRLIEIFLK